MTELGDAVSDGVEVTLVSASASQVVTDFGTNGQVSVKFASTTRGASETTTSVVFSRLPLNLPAGQLPYVSTTGNQISVILDSTPGKESTVQDAIDAINANGQSASLVRADVQSGNSQVVISDLSFSPLLLLPSSSKVVQLFGYVGLGDSPHEVVLDSARHFHRMSTPFKSLEPALMLWLMLRVNLLPMEKISLWISV